MIYRISLVQLLAQGTGMIRIWLVKRKLKNISFSKSFLVQLIIGNYGLSVDQAQVQMGMWCLMAAPLIMSNDLRKMRPEFAEILLNRDAIKINQDPLGVQVNAKKRQFLFGFQFFHLKIHNSCIAKLGLHCSAVQLVNAVETHEIISRIGRGLSFQLEKQRFI